MNSRRDMLELVCELSDEEVLARARAHATCMEELTYLASAKAAFDHAHKLQVKEQQGMADRMTECVRTGKEKKLVACITHFHVPNVGMKTTVRLDVPGEIVKEEAMSSFELQENLFEEKSADAAPDELYGDAVRLVFEFGKASASVLQRRLRIGYGRASGLLDAMERAGLIGAADGSKPRRIIGELKTVKIEDAVRPVTSAPVSVGSVEAVDEAAEAVEVSAPKTMACVNGQCGLCDSATCGCYCHVPEEGDEWSSE